VTEPSTTRAHGPGGSRRDILRYALSLCSVVLVTFEVAFLHEPTVVTSLVIYAIDAVFLAWMWRAPTDAPRWRVIAGSVPIDILFLWSGLMVGGTALVLWVRLLRLVRIGTIFGVLGRFERAVTTNTAAVRIVRLLTVAVLVLHLLACVWYLIPFESGFPADSWTVREGIVGEDTGTVYLRSIYWVVTTTTTVGFGDITPANQAEYVFSLIVMLIGASLFAYVIASGAALLSGLDVAKTNFWGRVEVVESYLRSRRVDPAVGNEVRRYYEYLWDRHRGIGEHALLADLPHPLRLQVLEELLAGMIENIPLFRYSPDALRDELLKSLEPLVVHPGGFIVRAGEVADGIYFIADGSADVVSEDESTVYATLGPGDYFGDLAMLLGERRSASVVARGFVEVFCLQVAHFERIREAYPELREVLTKASQEKSATVAELVLEGVVL
jgi:CRP-like cAMP-binding protein